VAEHGLAFLLDYSPKYWGTREEFHRQLCVQLRDRGQFPVLVFSEEVAGEVRERFEAAGAAVYAISYRAGRRRYFSRLGQLIRRHRISLAHIRFFDYFSLLPWMARLHGVRGIIFTEANSGEWKPAAGKAQLIRLRTRVTCYPLTRVVAISRFIKDRLAAVGIHNDIIDVVYNGVDLDRFAPDPRAAAELRQRYTIDPRETVLLTASSLLPWKHPEVILQACGLLAKQGVPFRLLVAGDGVLRPGLEALAARLDIADRIHWLGEQKSVEHYFQGADIFVLASVGEAFGNVIAEAMSCGTPVVGSRSGAIPELVEDGQTGLLAEPMNPESFATAIRRLTEDPESRAQMSRQARARAQRLFPVSACVVNTLAVYEAASSGPKHSQAVLAR